MRDRLEESAFHGGIRDIEQLDEAMNSAIYDREVEWRAQLCD